jgi:AcrR family transcriptional regulator
MATRPTARFSISQASRSAAMKARLIEAAGRSLLEQGYARTTAVEVCARAGVTRGAFFHHFSGLSALFAATLDGLCTAMIADARVAAEDARPDKVLPAFVDQAWLTFGRPDFKIVIEIWLAARNDPVLRTELAPVIGKFRELASPADNPELARTLGDNPAAHAFYRLVMEAMIGIALGRALSPNGALGHEAEVIDLLRGMAGGIA